MSYRLIDSNALAQTHPEVNDMPCIYAELDCLDGRHYDLREPSTLQAENAKLRELVNGMRYCANESYGMCARVPVGGERPFTCCPLYDFDTKEYRCEKLMHALGIEVDE